MPQPHMSIHQSFFHLPSFLLISYYSSSSSFLSFFLPFFLSSSISISLCFYHLISSSIHLSYLSICPSISPIDPSNLIYLSICLSMYLSINLSIYQSIYLSILLICLSICLCFSICIPVRLRDEELWSPPSCPGTGDGRSQAGLLPLNPLPCHIQQSVATLISHECVHGMGNSRGPVLTFLSNNRGSKSYSCCCCRCRCHEACQKNAPEVLDVCSYFWTDRSALGSVPIPHRVSGDFRRLPGSWLHVCY